LVDLLHYHDLPDEVFVIDLISNELDVVVGAANREYLLITRTLIAVNGNKVDFADIDVSKVSLPFSVSLNSGVPSLVLENSLWSLLPTAPLPSFLWQGRFDFDPSLPRLSYYHYFE
jgi:hypothetical protein